MRHKSVSHLVHWSLDPSEPVVPVRQCEIRRLDSGDLQGVRRVERACFRDPWGRAWLEGLLVDCRIGALVAVLDGKVAGYVVYRLGERHLELLSLAVHPRARLRRIGTGLAAAVLRRLDSERTAVVAYVWERAPVATQFFASCGFVASGTAGQPGRGFYRFVFRRGWPLPGEPC